jgi:cobalamin synthase
VWAMTVSNRSPRPKEELDRELGELLNEVRVGLPGVTVLFAFLLTLPFAARFQRLSGAQQTAYYVAFYSAAIAMVCLVTPSAFHRIRWRRGDKEAILRASNRVVLAGFACLAVALVASVLLVSELVLPEPLPFIAAAVVGVLALALWFGLPVSRRLRGKGDTESGE